jgi:hypothetical protein
MFCVVSMRFSQSWIMGDHRRAALYDRPRRRLDRVQRAIQPETRQGRGPAHPGDRGVQVFHLSPLFA